MPELWTVIARAIGKNGKVQMRATEIEGRPAQSTTDGVRSSAVNAYRWAFDDEPTQIGVAVLPYDAEEDEIEDERIKDD